MTPEQEQSLYHLLLVDDNKDFLVVMSNILRKHGFTVSVCPSSYEIWQCIEFHLPDLILMDVRMPGISGNELCAAIKNNPETRSIPVVFLSSSHNLGSEANSAGADGYIGKHESYLYVKKYVLEILHEMNRSRRTG